MKFDKVMMTCSSCGYREHCLKPNKLIFGITRTCPLCGSKMYSSPAPDVWPVETPEERKRWQELIMAQPLGGKR